MLVICNLYFLVELPDELRELKHIIIVSKKNRLRRHREMLTKFSATALTVKEKEKRE